MSAQEITEVNKGGRPPKKSLIGSIHEAFEPYQAVYVDCEPSEIAAEAARSIAHRYPQMDAAVKAWDALLVRDRMRPRALDNCVLAARMDLEEFKALCHVVVRRRLHELAETKQLAALPVLVEKSVEAAQGDKGSKERQKHLEKTGLLLPPPGLNINVSANAQAANVSKGDSFAEYMNSASPGLIRTGDARARSLRQLPTGHDEFCHFLTDTLRDKNALPTAMVDDQPAIDVTPES